MGSSVILPQPGQPGPMKPGEFVSGSTPALITFDTVSVAPPSPLYIQRDDVLFMQAATRLTPGSVTFNWRVLAAPVPRGGQPGQPGDASQSEDPRNTNVIEVGSQVITLNTPGQPVFAVLGLSEGYLLSVAAADTGGLSLTRGQTFAKAMLLRGGLGLANVRIPLFADYTIPNNPVGWPNGRVLAPSEGTGWRHSLQIATPAAGADFTFTAGLSQRLGPVSLAATFTAAVAVANRNITVIFDDGANILFQDDLSAAVVATQTVSVNGCQTNVPTGIITTTLFFVIPPGMLLEPGWRIRSSTANIQAADQWSAIWMNVEELLENV